MIFFVHFQRVCSAGPPILSLCGLAPDRRRTSNGWPNPHKVEGSAARCGQWNSWNEFKKWNKKKFSVRKEKKSKTKQMTTTTATTTTKKNYKKRKVHQPFFLPYFQRSSIQQQQSWLDSTTAMILDYLIRFDDDSLGCCCTICHCVFHWFF